jgi:hypothetical protein
MPAKQILVMRNVLSPNCKLLRDKLVLALKLFDFAHFSNGSPYLVLDTDVFFLQTPVELRDALVGRSRRSRSNQDPPVRLASVTARMMSAEKAGLRPERIQFWCAGRTEAIYGLGTD